MRGVSRETAISYLLSLFAAARPPFRADTRRRTTTVTPPRPHPSILRFAFAAAAFAVALATCAAPYAQGQVAGRDSAAVARPLPLDSAVTAGADSLRPMADTTITAPAKDGVDTLISYQARDSVVYDLHNKRLHLYGAVKIDYGRTGFTAERVTIDWESSTMHGEGVPDTTAWRRDSVRAAREQPLVGTPVLRDGGDEYKGREMTYNYRSKQGLIIQGESGGQDNYYLGERIKRKGDDLYYVCNGSFTSCDDPTHKHYRFSSTEMKVIKDDAIVARPVIFSIEDIPLFWLPFAVVPAKNGRSSGILIPVFGNDASRGYNVRNGGYYFTLSDYWDLSLTGDWYSKGGYQVQSRARYALRYAFTGQITASYGRQNYNVGNVGAPDDEYRTDYRFAVQHNQQINPTSSVVVDASFMSDSYYANFSNNLNQLLSSEARSTATYNTRWEGTSRSLSVNAQRVQNLVTGAWQMTLPDVSFNLGQLYPFKRGSDINQPWYMQTGIDYRARGVAAFELRKRTVITGGDTSIVDDRFDRQAIEQNFSLISTPKLGYFTISPNFSFRERWYPHRTLRAFNPADSTVTPVDEFGFFPLHTFSVGVSASTKVYGTFAPGILGIEGLRHTVQPSLSYSFNPDFSKESWGYYQTYIGPGGREVRYDPYSGYGTTPGELSGGVGTGKSQSLGMSLSNIFEMKLRPAAGDTTFTPRKFQLFTLDATTNYNFAADSMRLSPVNLNIRTSIRNFLDLYGSATFSPYTYVQGHTATDASGQPVTIPGMEVNRYMLDDGTGLARLTSLSFNMGTNLSAELLTAGVGGEQDTSRRIDRETMRRIDEGTAYTFSMPWTITLNYNYSMSRYDPSHETRSSSLRAGFTISPTPNWHVTANAYYDIVRKEIGSPQIVIGRDLHCWEMNFDWIPSGPYRRFDLVIRLKAPQLRDLKLEKHGSDSGRYGY
jgi:hypothetical protein